MTKEQMESSILKLQEDLENLASKVGLLEIIAKNQPAGTREAPPRDVKNVIQIIANGKSYFCQTPQEQEIFQGNNPGVEIESHNIELATPTADKYLTDPENIKQFTKKKVEETVNA